MKEKERKREREGEGRQRGEKGGTEAFLRKA